MPCLKLLDFKLSCDFFKSNKKLEDIFSEKNIKLNVVRFDLTYSSQNTI